MTEFRTTALRSRTLIFAAFVACAFLGILLRVGYLQILKHEEYSRLAEAQRAKTVPLRPKRGPILDRAGLVLAESAVAESLFGLPTRMSDSARVASELASILGEPASDIGARTIFSSSVEYPNARCRTVSGTEGSRCADCASGAASPSTMSDARSIRCSATQR